MSKESRFHNLIEQQKNECKQKVWERINAEVEIDSNLTNDIVRISENTLSINPKKIYIPIATILAVLAVVLILIFTLKPISPVDDIRYCSKIDYTNTETLQTLKEYSQETNRDLLYFDWYDDTEFYSDELFKLNSNNEVICFKENIVDIETGSLVTLSVTDNRTVIDFLENFDSSCPYVHSFNGVEIKWGGNEFESFAKFEYKSNTYYITLAEPFEIDYIITLIEQLIEK